MSEPEAPLPPPAAARFTDTYFYVAVGVGGGVAFILLVIVIILGCWISRRGRKIKGLQRDAEAGRRKAEELEKRLAQKPQTQIVQQAPAPVPAVIYQREPERPVVQPQPVVIVPSVYVDERPTTKPNNQPVPEQQPADNFVEDREPRRVSRKPKNRDDGLPRLQPPVNEYPEEEYNKRQSRKPVRDLPGDQYGQEMKAYGGDRFTNKRYPEDEFETSSAILPRVQPKHKPIKRNNSLDRIKESPVDDPHNQPFSYFGAPPSKYPLSNAARRDFDVDDQPHKPVEKKLSPEEFDKRRSFIQQKAINEQRSHSPQAQRKYAAQNGFSRADPNRRSTSASPDRRHLTGYLYPAESRRD